MNRYSTELFDLMVANGYPEDFAFTVASEMDTEFTSGRMIGYISKTGRVRMEQVADEMLAVLNDRDRIRDKHLTEHTQGKLNDIYRKGL